MLKVFSKILDEDTAAGRTPPRRILDAGCGAGIIGICAAALAPQVAVRCQDRDELARLITLHNAAKNGISPAVLSAHTEALLAGYTPESGWDIILSNIPAKAGKPVLEDFTRRSAAQLNSGGRVIMVTVNTLADFLREKISAVTELVREERGAGHTVLVYGRTAQDISGISDNWYSVYARAVVSYPIEGIPVRLETIHGAGGFDNPGGAALAAAKLVCNMGHESFNGGMRLLCHEPDQGFFPCWLLKFLNSKSPQKAVLSGRNILALEAARRNITLNGGTASIVPAADLHLGREALLAENGGQYECITAFPELLPQSSLPKGADQLAALWDSIPPLLCAGGIFLAAFTSSDAERFDRKKPAGFTRLGGVKRHGFRALVFRKIQITK